jgi:uncharacterized protein (DUF58 family)
MFTLRWYGLALLFPVFLLSGLIFPWIVPVALVYGIGLLLVTLLDRQSAGSARQFEVKRLHDQKLSLGAPNRIIMQVEARGQRRTQITVRDEPPLIFVIPDGVTRQATISPRETLSLDYYARPVQRGDFKFGDLNLRWLGPLGLYTRQAVVTASEVVKVYPNLFEMRKYELLVRRDQLAEMGLRNVRQRGEGTAFESLRDYTPDDQYRSINWKATARRGKPISTDYEPERSQRVMIGIDVGRMMRSPIRIDDPGGVSWNMAKADFVINSVLLLSYVASRKGDQVGLIVFADQVQQFIAPGPGASHFQKLLEAMYALGSQPVEADYSRAVSYLRSHNKKRSLVVMFTDLSGARASESLLLHMPRLAPAHLPLLVTIRDPALDLEARQKPDDSDSVYRRAVAEQLLDERRLLLDNLRTRGVLTLDADAQHLSMSVVNRYLELKNRMLFA